MLLATQEYNYPISIRLILHAFFFLSNFLPILDR